MPACGGYLDQPRRWRALIHLMNRRFGLAFEQAKAEHDPDSGGRREQDIDVSELLMDSGSGYGWSDLPRD